MACTGFANTELDSYIEEMSVRCVTPSGLLKEVNVDMQDLVTFILDAEGYDNEILSVFLTLDGFAPAYVQFEGSPKGLFLVKQLALRGYHVYQVRHDFIGVLVADTL